MRFVSIDVETANPELSSICQIGMVVFENGQEIDSWSSLINPETWFHWANVDVHGIEERHVRNSPVFADILPVLRDYMAESVMVSHTAFDRNSINLALGKLDHPAIPCRWLDSARIARRTWEEFAYRGYGLKNLADFVGFEFQHHDALEDARAAGKILLAALEASGKSLEEWETYSKKRIIDIYGGGSSRTTYNYSAIEAEGDPDGPLFGEEVVFTGTLSITRREMAEIAAKAGCTVSPTVKKKSTTLLVVGVQDPQRLRGSDISSKQRKAEAFIAKGASIRILTERDYLALLRDAGIQV